MNPLAKVTDGADASALTRAGAFNFFLAAPWIALWFGVHATGGGWFAVFLAGTLMAGGVYLFSRIPEGEETPSSGVWLTTRKGRWRRQAAARAPLLGMLVMLIMAIVASVWKEPAWEAVYALCVAAAFGVQAFLAARKARPIDDVELRIDDAGLYSRDLGGTLAWDQILEIRPRLRGDEAILRLAVGPNTLPGLSASQREQGGKVIVSLCDAGVHRDVVIAALTAHRPCLDPTAGAVKTAEAVFVLPIEGVYVEPPVEADGAALGPVLVGIAIGAAISS
jgi:hypothetical protein